MQVNVIWLRENDIVKKLLRANLHHKQYVDQVRTASVCDIKGADTSACSTCHWQPSAA